MKTLYLCEKPSQAKDIARVLQANKRQNGYYEDGDTLVTWCFGHLLEMAAPEEYDDSLKKWRLESLPIVPEQWVWNVRKDAKKQYNVIVSLFKKADKIVIATDADREGEAIAREVMDKGGWQGPINRLWLSALDESSIRKALTNCLSGSKTETLYYAAIARSKADWLVGMTLSRLYTLIAQQSGVDGVMSVGRVQTPTLNLVVERDRVVENFVPVSYFDVQGTFAKEGATIVGKWLPSEEISDEEGRCLNQLSAQSVADQCLNQTGVVTSAETKRVKEPAPLVYSLSALQQEASRLFGMGAKDVLDAAQSLYETYKATTYPRTGCRYLPESQFQEAPDIVKSLQQHADYLALIKRADTTIKSKCWDDKKITAHHGIIPTVTPIDSATVAKMKANERNIYDLICRRYLAQFLPPHEYDQTRIELCVGRERFISNGRVSRVVGWKIVLGGSEDSCGADLPPFFNDDVVQVIKTEIEPKKTKPPSRYTEGTLLHAMENIGKQVDDPGFKKMLKDTAGLGEESTRASIIETLLKRGFITKEGKKKNLINGDNARALIDALPGPVKDPVMTAIWEQALDEIAHGQRDAEQFVQDQVKTVTLLTEQVKQNQPKNFTQVAASSPVYRCPECDQPLFKRKAKKGAGFFWGCSGYPDCTVTRPDNQGKPGEGRGDQKTTGKGCPECGEGELVERITRNGKQKGKTFLGCNQYPKCKFTEFIMD